MTQFRTLRDQVAGGTERRLEVENTDLVDMGTIFSLSTQCFTLGINVHISMSVLCLCWPFLSTSALCFNTYSECIMFQ